MPFILSSPAIPPGGTIPTEYTCDGADLSPAFRWSGAPAGTKSFALVILDPDAPRGTFHHWAVYDIPASRDALAAGYGPSRPAAGLREAENDFGKAGYGGPCPPAASAAHHYHIELFALDRPTLDLASPASVTSVLAASHPYVIGEAELIGTYRRRR